MTTKLIIVFAAGWIVGRFVERRRQLIAMNRRLRNENAALLDDIERKPVSGCVIHPLPPVPQSRLRFGPGDN